MRLSKVKVYISRTSEWIPISSGVHTIGGVENCGDIEYLWYLSDGHFMFVYIWFWDIPDPGTPVTPDPGTASTTPGSAECPVVSEVERINCIPDQPPTKVWIMDLIITAKFMPLGSFCCCLFLLFCLLCVCNSQRIACIAATGGSGRQILYLYLYDRTALGEE